MDPFSITIAAFGITGTALNGIAGLRKTIGELSETQEELDAIRTQLENIGGSLGALQSLALADEETSAAFTQTLSMTGMTEAVNSCGKACATFDKKLQNWTRHSASKLSLRDKLSVGVWNKEKIRTLRTRVETCQQTAHFAVSGTQLVLQEKSARKSDASYELLSQQMRTLELQAKEQLELTKKQQNEVIQRQQVLAGDFDDDDDDEDNAQRSLAVNEINEQSRLLDETQVSLGVVFAQLRAGRTHQEIGNVVTDQESMALVGLPERLVGKMDQHIGNVSTTNKSASLVGVFDQGVDVRDFFKRT